jgi:hypothetical protein
VFTPGGNKGGNFIPRGEIHHWGPVYLLQVWNFIGSDFETYFRTGLRELANKETNPL